MPVYNAPDTQPTEVRYLRFVGELGHCLKFHHEYVQPEETKDEDPLAKLIRKLQKQFFDELFVHRSECDELFSLSHDQNLIILSGPMGAGKTTILKNVARLLSQQTGYLAHYLDLRKKSSEMEIAQTEHKPSVCSVLFEDLYNAHIEKRPQHIIQGYRVFRVQHHASFVRVRRSINEKHAPATTEEWSAALSIPKYDEWTDRIEERLDLSTDQFNSKRTEDAKDPMSEEVRVLLDYLNTIYSRVVVIVDNIDRYSTRLQRDVIKKAIDLAGHCTPVVAVRTRHMHQLTREEDAGRDGDTVHILQLLERAHRSLRLTTDMVREFINKRLDFFLKHSNQAAVIQDVRGNISELKRMLNLVLDVRYASSTLSVLDQWHNHSLRHIGITISESIGALIANRDPAFNIDSIIKGGDSIGIRQLRTYLYKYIICRGALHYTRNHGIWNFYRSQYETETLPYPELALIRYLFYKQKHVAKFSDVIALFGRFGVKKEVTVKVVNNLVYTRHTDPGGDGFVLVDQKSGRLNDSSSADTSIELQPSGSLMVEYLSLTNEYLFWTALDVDSSLSISYKDTIDDGCRARIASMFLLNNIGKKLYHAEKIASRSPLAKSVFEQIFGREQDFLMDLVTSIRKFVSFRGTDAMETRKCLERVEVSYIR